MMCLVCRRVGVRHEHQQCSHTVIVGVKNQSPQPTGFIASIIRICATGCVAYKQRQPSMSNERLNVVNLG